MSNVKITDLVDQGTIDKVKELNETIQELHRGYVNALKDLARGIQIKVTGIEDLDRMEEVYNTKTKEIAAAQEKLTRAVEEQRQVYANTTNTISRVLMEKERENKVQRDTYNEYGKVKQLLDQYYDTYENQVQSLVKVNKALADNKKAQKENEAALKSGDTTTARYMATQTELVAKHRSLTQEKRTLMQIMTAEEKAAQSQEESYVQMSQRLELLKKAYKDLSEEGRESEFGKELEVSIQNLDAHLKDTAADMGEFQRNVGNYAIAGQNGVVSTESLTAAMERQAVTQQDLADQTKILEEAKLMLDQQDANYTSTLDSINAKLEENRQKLTDVSDILGKEATTVAEAEAQNKRLAEAMKHVDLTSADAKKKLEEMRAQVERNTKTINEATGANEKLAGGLLNLVGLNMQFGSSLRGLETARTGNFIAGLNTQVKALGKTLVGLLANPWVLAFLGIAGVAFAVKWWYDYNKGLEEASRLTKNFTGATGDACDKVTAQMDTLAGVMDKDFNETISSANVLVQQFGISWDDAYQLMKEGIAAGADMNGKMVANIERFAPALRDAGVSASEFMAILSNTRNGIFNEDGVQSIIKASTRLRAMTKQTEAALEAVGISAKKMQSDLESGNITMLEAVQQVSDKLKELPENSQEAGNIIKNVFGRTAAEGGTLLIQSIADVNTNLDECKGQMGDISGLTEEHIEATEELKSTVMALFKMNDDGFERMTISAKTYITKGITAIIKGIVDVVNWFVNLYNKSLAVRLIFESIVNSFKTLWAACKLVVGQIIDSFKALGDVIEGVFTLDYDKVKAGWERGMAMLKKNVGDFFAELSKNSEDAMQNILNGQMEEVSLNLDGDAGGGNGGDGNRNGGGGGDDDDDDDKDDGKKDKDAQKRIQEQLRILNELENARIDAMEAGHDKEIALIRQKYKQKLDAIKGESDNEKALRLQLIEQMETEIANYELTYQQNLAKINLDNRLAIVKEGSQEELTLRLAQLEAKRQEELKAAKASGADTLLIEEKYLKEREKLENDYAKKRAQALQEEYALRQIERDKTYTDEVVALKKSYAEKLAAAKNDASKQEALKRKLDYDLLALQMKYSEESAQAAVNMIEDILKVEKISVADQMKWEEELAKAKMNLSDEVADNAVQNAEKQAAADNELRDKRLENVKYWLDVASQTISAISDLTAALFDGQLEKLENQQDANTAAGEAEQERIEELVHKKVITEEEGEARKRAAEAATARKEEELERKKANLKRKQAIFDKAAAVANIGLNTAMAMMELWVKPGWPIAIPMQAVVGALSAIQLATVLATPIPAYAKGTDYHKGGPAIVGDGGRPELVLHKGMGWLTPDIPTLVELPEGAAVLPDVATFDGGLFKLPELPPVPEKTVIVSKYDDTSIRMLIRELAGLIRQQTKSQRETAYLQNYENFKNRI